jgi:pyruvate/2-oxoglutarate dehydrogenase complex dihydrolipoamide dehydrogenase (E3) component
MLEIACCTANLTYLSLYLVSYGKAARRGAKSAMISMELAGGDCLNAGCVPSKALLKCAKVVREARKAAAKNNEYGVHFTRQGDQVEVEVAVDFGKVMERMRRLRSSIAPVDGHARGNEIGSKVFQGKGVFTSPYTIEVVSDGRKLGDANNPVLTFRKAVIATGGRPSIPNIKGLTDAPYTTNLNLFNLQSLPQRMVILGAGVVALEMAQSFAAFGSKVTVLARSNLLKGDDDAGKVIRQTLEEDGVKFLEDVDVKEVKTLRRRGETGELPLMSVSLTHKGSSKTISLECECLLVAIGRTANVQNMGLESANVTYHPSQGVLINDYAQSISNPNIYAVGDCVAHVPRLTHMSGEMAKVVVQNSLFYGDWRMSSLVVPAVMYTEPEYAVVKRVITLDGKGHVIATPKQTEEVDVYKTQLRTNDRAILDSSDANGYVSIFCQKGTGDILSCTIVSSRAGEMINEVSLAIKNGIDIRGIGRNIHAYPTLGEGVMGCGLQFIGGRWEKLNG